MDHVAGSEVEGAEVAGALDDDDAVEPEPTDFTDDLDRLAVVEADLAAAEAELEALESSTSPSVSE